MGRSVTAVLGYIWSEKDILYTLVFELGVRVIHIWVKP
jgi:hypothetical protein